jgi:hypothetical protein
MRSTPDRFSPLSGARPFLKMFPLFLAGVAKGDNKNGKLKRTIANRYLNVPPLATASCTQAAAHRFYR